MKTEKEYAFLLLDYLIEKNNKEIRICMPELVPFVTTFINDVIQNIKQYSSIVLEKLLKCSGNIDLDSFIPIVLKKDPRLIELLWKEMWKATHYAGRGAPVSFAIAAVDVALWDLKGKCLNEPLWLSLIHI